MVVEITPPGGASIGGSITGGTDGSVLFVHPSGFIAQDNANFNYNNTTKILTIGSTDTGPGGMIVNGAGTGSSIGSPVSLLINNDGGPWAIALRDTSVVGGSLSDVVMYNAGAGARLNGASAGGALLFAMGDSLGGFGAPLVLDQTGMSIVSNLGVSPTSSAFDVQLPGAGNESFSILNNGNAGFMLSGSPIIPTAYVNIGAGTATAGTSPLKLTSGVNLTSPEAGAVEFDGTFAYVTNSLPNRNTIVSVTKSGRSLAQTGAVASVAAYTVGAADGSFLVSSNANITTFVAGTFNVQVAYTDETNTARTLTLNFSSLTGTLGVALAATGPFEGIPAHIRCKASTSITVKTAGTFTSLTYNVEGYIAQIG